MTLSFETKIDRVTVNKMMNKKHLFLLEFTFNRIKCKMINLFTELLIFRLQKNFLN
jgi:hypothetical protein